MIHMRVLVLYNELVLPQSHPDADSEHEILHTRDIVSEELKHAGYQVVHLGVGRDPYIMLAGIRKLRPDVVKPAFQDASVGLDQGSVVTDQFSLSERVAYLLDKFGPPVMIEEFVRGRELNVALIETPDLHALPISEILFTDEDPNYWPI